MAPAPVPADWQVAILEHHQHRQRLWSLTSPSPTPADSALTGFLASYGGLTREAYALDLRQFVAWCDQHDLYLVRGPAG